MIKFSENLYTTKSTASAVNRIKLKLISGIGILHLYLITLSANGDDLFDIIPAAQFKVRKFRRMNHVIVGVADSKRAAFKMTEQMILDCEAKTGSFDNMRAYFEDFFLRGK